MMAVDVAQAALDHRWMDGSGKKAVVAKLPTRHASKEASASVLSYKWDKDLNGASRNIFLAIQYCLQKKIGYLFLDQVSIDSRLQGGDLLTEVASLGALYETLPVIAAYDNPDEQFFLNTVRRPWITYEMLSYAKNLSPIVYLSHIEDHGCGRIERVTGKAYKTDDFNELCRQRAQDSLANSAFLTLSGIVDMADIADYRFIVPPYQDVIDAAVAQFDKNDFLLAVGLLLSEANKKLSNGLAYTDRNGNLQVKELEQAPVDHHAGFVRTLFERFELRHNAETTCSEIYIDGLLIAHWRSRQSYANYTSMNAGENKLFLEPEAGRNVFHSLGFSEEDYRERRARLAEWLLRFSAVARPDVELLFWDDKQFSAVPESKFKKRVAVHYGTHIDVVAVEGLATVGRWLAKDNDLVQLGGSLVNLVTNDGRVQSLTAPATGYLEIFAFEDAVVDAGEVIARLEKPD